MRDKILVTEASGNMGQKVLKSLRAGRPDAAIRITFIQPRETRSFESDDEIVHHVFQKPAKFAVAVADCTSFFLLRPPGISNTRETLLFLMIFF